MSAAADAEDKTEKHAVTPGPLAPARELYGVMLLERGMAKEALAAFEATKAKEPNRFHGYAGAAQAAEKLGDKADGKGNYQKLVTLVGDGDSEPAGGRGRTQIRRQELAAVRARWFERTTIAVIAAFGLGVLGAALPCSRAARPSPRLAVSPQLVLTETQWPFPIDQWGKGKAFRCEAADCGTEVMLYLRAKIGFCNCTTGVADDDELTRISDLELMGGKPEALGDGRPIRVGWMNGRSRTYALTGTQSRQRSRSDSTTAATPSSPPSCSGTKAPPRSSRACSRFSMATPSNAGRRSRSACERRQAHSPTAEADWKRRSRNGERERSARALRRLKSQ